MNYHKLFLIIRREFLTRVRSKGFIIATILAPIGLLVVFTVPILLAVMDSDSEPRIAVIDANGSVYARLAEKNPERYTLASGSELAALKEDVLEDVFQGLLIIPADPSSEKITFFYAKGGLELTSRVENNTSDAMKRAQLAVMDVDDRVKELLLNDPLFETTKLTDQGESAGNEDALFFVGYIMGFFIYIAIFIYGALVMRGVIEEKSNRIMEVIASSVTPFELMMGKILGVGAVGLVQFVGWSVISQGMMLAVAPIAAMLKEPSQTATADAAVGLQMPEISIWVWVAFIFFFLAGFLIYAAMFAAVGSAVDNEQDAQQLQFPITIPVIIPILMIAKVVADPHSTLSVAASIFPLFSPILMMVRLAVTEVPFWQWGLSVALMIGTFAGLVWVAARIYRVGMLMYGKKPTFGELFRWIRQA